MFDKLVSKKPLILATLLIGISFGMFLVLSTPRTNAETTITNVEPAPTVGDSVPTQSAPESIVVPTTIVPTPTQQVFSLQSTPTKGPCN